MNNSKQEKKSITKIFSFLNNIALEYTLTLNDNDIKQYKINLNKIKTLEDLNFLIENKNLWLKIEASSSNSIIKTLLYYNKLSDNKAYSEIILFNNFEYSEDKKNIQFEELINYVHEQHYLFLTYITDDNIRSKFNVKTISNSVTLIIKYNERTIGKFVLSGSDNNENVYEEPKETQMDKDNENVENNNNKENEEGKEQDTNEQKFTAVLEQGSKYHYFIFDYTNISLFHSLDDFISLIKEIKLIHRANIIMLFYESLFNLSSPVSKTNDEMLKLNKLYFLTDIYIYPSIKSIVTDLNTHLQTVKEVNKNKNNKSNINNIKEITEKNYTDYFIRTIACNGQLNITSSKLCVVLDLPRNKLIQIEVPHISSKTLLLTYDVKPYPKVNHTNVNLINQYKTILSKLTPELFQHVFISGYLSQILSAPDKNRLGIDIMYPAYLTGVEITKRILDLKMNNLSISMNKDFYKVKLNFKEINEFINKYYKDQIEGNFVLDCVNKQKSQMQYYIPLFDNNLHLFFESMTVRKELTEKGFINEKGYINYDPVYRDGMRKKIIKTDFNKMNALQKQEVIKKKYIETNNTKAILRSPSPTCKRLPTDPCVFDKVKCLKCGKYNKKRSNSKRKECEYCLAKPIADKLYEIEIQNRKNMQLRKY